MPVKGILTGHLSVTNLPTMCHPSRLVPYRTHPPQINGFPTTHTAPPCHYTYSCQNQPACQICFKPMRSDIVKRHMEIYVKYSNEYPQSTEDICTEIVDKIVGLVEESSGMKRKHEEITEKIEHETTIDEEALEKSALKINKENKKRSVPGIMIHIEIINCN